eukprot:GDKJ01042219.1.p1 GENE.GDKJ01042219.1~~GDKJ01042219.1.p1  ORF type:complete len:180 (-),score=7.65 GDKJ01042219.1:134-673(-)
MELNCCSRELLSILFFVIPAIALSLLFWTLDHVKDVRCDFYETTDIRISGWGIIASLTAMYLSASIKLRSCFLFVVAMISGLTFFGFQLMFIITSFLDFEKIESCNSKLFEAVRPTAIYFLSVLCCLVGIPILLFISSCFCQSCISAAKSKALLLGLKKVFGDLKPPKRSVNVPSTEDR